MGKIFFETFLMIFLAEMGDKSQFLMIAVSAEYRLREILPAIAAAILSLNALAIGFGSLLANLIPAGIVSLLAGTAFLLFAWTGLSGKAETHRARGARYAFPAIFGTFFLAELGDKTQLSALTLSAQYGDSVWTVFFAASMALFAADVLGLLVGAFLGKRLPTAAFSAVSTVLFSVCGILRLLEGMETLFASSPHPTAFPILGTSFISVCFVLLCAVTMTKSRRKGGTSA